MNQVYRKLAVPVLCGVVVSSLAHAQAEPDQAPAAEAQPPAEAVPADTTATPGPVDAEVAPAPPSTAAAELAPTAPIQEPRASEALDVEPSAVTQAPEPMTVPELEPTFPRFDPSMRLITGFERESTRRYTTRGTVEQEGYGFFLGQARAQLQGELTKRIDIEISAELSDGYDPSTSKPQYIRDAFMNLRPERELQLRAGLFKRPLSALELRNSGKLQVRGRGLTNSFIVDDNAWGSRGLGLQLWGEFKKLDIEWAVGAFDPFWAPDSNTRPKGADLLARAAIEPVQGLTLALNGGLKTLKYPGNDKYQPYHVVGGDVELDVGGFSLLIDALYAELPVGSVDNQAAMGLVGLTSYDVPLSPHVVLQPVLFGEYFDSSVDHSNSETLRAIVGLNWIFHETLRIMPQVELIHWLGDPSEFSPTEGLTPYLMFSLAM